MTNSRFRSHEEKALAALKESHRQKGALVDLMAREPELSRDYIKRQQERFRALQDFAYEWADRNLMIRNNMEGIDRVE